MPKVSVIIPAYNRAQFIREAIDSVLAQTYQDFEIVVVNDGSTDETGAIVKSYSDPRIIYIEQENKGLPSARNTGISKASGEYIALLDSDDFYLPNKLAVQVPVLDENEDVGLVASGFIYVDGSGQCIQQVKLWESRPELNIETVLWHGVAPVNAILVRKSWFLRINGFDPFLKACEDLDLYFRMIIENCAMLWVKEIVCVYRIHSTNMTKQIQWHGGYFTDYLNKAFSHPDLPKQIQIKKNEIFADFYAFKGSRLYGIGEISQAREDLLKALELSPIYAHPQKSPLIKMVVGIANSFWVGDKETYIQKVTSDLPEYFPNGAMIARQIKIGMVETGFFQAYESKERKKVIFLTPTLLFIRPSYLLNRGIYSILAQCLGLTRWKFPKNEDTSN